MIHFSFEVKNLAALETVAEQILAATAGRRKFVLKGDMGAGKTTLVSMLCKKLGSIDQAASPTYALINKYKTNTNFDIYHVDLYRIDKLDDNMYAEMEEMLFDSSYIFIEWADIIMNFLPHDHVTIEVLAINDGPRQINLYFI
jgi:tRNA threonylcarbamoyladenosine biosynthesis protein TsaE